MNDHDFLNWIHERLQNVHGEDPRVDYMQKLKTIIQSTPRASNANSGYPWTETPEEQRRDENT